MNWLREQKCRCRSAGGWTLKEESAKYAPDRTCDVTHLKIEVKPDLPKKRIEATATLSLEAAYGPFLSIGLDAVDLEIDSIRDSRGRDLDYTYLQNKLVVRFPKPVKEREDLVIEYRKEGPRRGLYFWGPTSWAPKREWQMWSQGEDEEARHWIPCHDAPNEKMTTEMVVTVPSKYTAISNGSLQSSTRKGRNTVWHYLESVPHTSYLISLVIGVFNKIEDDLDGLPVEYFVEPGREEEAERSFGKTPAMIQYFAELLECPFPYEKYAQVVVRHFIFGGMENTSATTQTDGTLHDKKAALDVSSDSLVSHELAHQWFGDLLTCKHWAHAWLNEGFATYFECLWREHAESFEEFEQNLIEDADDYFDEGYLRAIVNHKFAYPIQLFDNHLYPKGGWVLHMLRRHVGDDLFWKALRLYVRRHAASTVETIDLMRAFEDATGKNLEAFFHQWLFSPGHPELETSFSWKSEDSVLEIKVKQTQSTKDGTPVFKIPVEVEARLKDAEGRARSARGKKASGHKAADAKLDDAKTTGARTADVKATDAKAADAKIIRRVFDMTMAEQTFYLELPSEPQRALLDPNARVLATHKLDMPSEWVRAALVGPARDTRVYARTLLVRQTKKEPSLATVRLLGEVVRKDPFWGVQAEAAEALSKIRTPEARDELLKSMKVSSAKARRGVMTALGEFVGDESVISALKQKIGQGDTAYHAMTRAYASYGKVAGAKGAPLLRKEMQKALKRRDWHDVEALGIARGLVAARDEDAVDDVLALATDPSRYWASRLHAFKALAELGSVRPALAPRISEAMEPHLWDEELLLAFSLPSAFGTLGYKGAIPVLERCAESAAVDELRDGCLRAIETITSKDQTGGKVDRLQSEIRRLEEETRTLRERLDLAEEKGAAAEGRRQNGRPSGSKSSPKSGKSGNRRSMKVKVRR